MIKSGLALGSGLIFIAIAFYFNKKENLLKVKESFTSSTVNEDNKYKLLLESVN